MSTTLAVFTSILAVLCGGLTTAIALNTYKRPRHQTIESGALDSEGQLDGINSLLPLVATPRVTELTLQILGRRSPEAGSSLPRSSLVLSARDLLIYAELLWAVNRKDDARRAMSSASDVPSEDPHDMLLLAFRADGYGRPELAAHFYERAMALGNTSPFLRSSYAETLLEIEGRTQEGINLMEKLRREFPNDRRVAYEYVKMRLQTLIGLEDRQLEFSAYVASVETIDDVARALRVMGYERDRLELSEVETRRYLARLAALAKELKEGIESKPTANVEVFALLANHYFLLHDDESAMRAYLEAITPWPAHLSDLAILAEHLASWGEPDLAIEFARLLLRENPTPGGTRAVINALAEQLKERSWALVVEALTLLRPGHPTELTIAVQALRPVHEITEAIENVLSRGTASQPGQGGRLIVIRHSVERFRLTGDEDPESQSAS
jgi:tetratricopeptide (TPR) repeat protein